MAERFSYWVHEQHPDHRGMTTAAVVRLALLAVLVALALSAVPTAQGGELAGDREVASLCEEHHGDPGWKAVCERR